MKLTRSQLKEIIREEIQKLNEKREIGGYYLMKQLKDLANDAKRNRERKLEKGLMYLHSRINQSYRDIDLSAKDVLDLFNDPRGRRYGRDVPTWMVQDLFEGLKEYMIKGVEVKDFVDEALKKAGIKALKYVPMKSGWLGSKFVWGGFYTVKNPKTTTILPFTVDKKGNLHLNVSPKKYIVGKIGNMSKVVKTLKDFKKTDIDIIESVNERK
tara:strand:- start:926 stop:1561 length:636 start_codon:yes stop_codon:yes gene_type:complete